MSLLSQGRGWVSADSQLELVQRTTLLKIPSGNFDDGDMVALQEADALKELYFTNVTFTGVDPDLADLPVLSTTIEVLSLNGCTGFDPTFLAGWSACTKLGTIELIDCDLTQAQADAFLVALNTARIAGLGATSVLKEVTLTGNAGVGTASSSARSALTGAGWTVSAAT